MQHLLLIDTTSCLLAVIFYADPANFMYSIAESLRSHLLIYSDQQYKLFCIKCSINYAVHYKRNLASLRGIVGTEFVDAEEVKPEVELLRPQFDFRTLALIALCAH